MTKTPVKHILYDLASLFLGVMLIFTFAPFSLPYLAPVLIAPLAFLWRTASKKRIFLRGYLFGLGFFGFGVYWIFISVYYFGASNIFIALLLTFLFISANALTFALIALCYRAFFSCNLHQILFSFPALWVLCEWLRTWLFTGFPWLFLSYGQSSSVLSGFAPIAGGFGITFLVVFCAMLLYFMTAGQKIRNQPKHLLLPVILLAIIFSTGAFLQKINWTTPLKQSLKISLIQGNIPQTMKWSESAVNHILEKYQRLTEKHWSSQLIIWPEAAITVAIPYIDPYLNALNTKAHQHKSAILLGVPMQANQKQFYNAAIGLGTAHGIYAKRHLVPFGEYLPFEHYLHGLVAFFNLPMSDFIPSQLKKHFIHLNHLTIAPFICYEIAYSALLRSDLPKASFIVTMSNDSWFGHSFAAIQHAQIASLRAEESRRPIVLVTNNGVTAFLNRFGQLTKTAPRFKTTILSQKITPRKGNTPWIFLGDLPMILLCFLILLFLGIKSRQRQ